MNAPFICAAQVLVQRSQPLAPERRRARVQEDPQSQAGALAPEVGRRPATEIVIEEPVGPRRRARREVQQDLHQDRPRLVQVVLPVQARDGQRRPPQVGGELPNRTR